VIGRKVFTVDGRVYGVITDLIFSLDGDIVFLVISKLKIPYLDLGICRKLIVPSLVTKLNKGYVLTVHHQDPSAYAMSYIPDTMRRRGMRIFNVWLGYLDLITIILIVASIATLLTLIAIYVDYSFILTILLVTLMTLLPRILREVYSLSIEGLLSYSKLVGSKVIDSEGSVIGIISDVRVDEEGDKVRGIIMLRYLAKEEALRAIYGDSKYVELPLRLISNVKRDCVILKSSIKESIPYVVRSTP